MHLLTTAKMIGLDFADSGERSGTIEQSVVLAALDELAASLEGHEDLFIEAADRVRNARSAGVERLDTDSVFARYREGTEIQLRYRTEMGEVFTDLAIDLGLRGVEVADPAESASPTTPV